MKRCYFVTFLIICCAHVNLYAQSVGIGTAVPDVKATLHLESTSQGFLLNRMTTLQRTTLGGTLAAAQEGMLVFDSDTGYFYYWDGTQWVALDGSASAWLLNGNTLAGTEKLGSLNGQPVAFYSSGSERMRLLANGQFSVNNASPAATDRFSSTAAANEYAVAGYASGTGRGVYGSVTGNAVNMGVHGTTNSTTDAAVGVYGATTGTSGVIFGVSGYTASTTTNAAGVHGSAAAGTNANFGTVGTTASTGTGAAGVLGYTTGNGTVYGVLGRSNSTTNSTAGVYGLASGATGINMGVYGQTNSATDNARGVYGYASATTGITYGVLGVTNSTSDGARGVFGSANGGSGVLYGVYGQTNSTTDGSRGTYGWASASSGAVYGLYGLSNSSGNNAAGVYGQAAGTSGITFGVNGVTLSTTNFAAGVKGSANGASGLTYGIAGYNAGTGANSCGALGLHTATSGQTVGVWAESRSQSGDRYGLVSVVANGAGTLQYVNVAAFVGGTQYKVFGPGAVSTLVKDTGGQKRVMYAPEAPEMLLQDYGKGRLVNGKAHIDLDPIYAHNIQVDERHPLRVFITLMGDCKGVYVTNTTSQGFDVAELMTGTSTTEFMYQVVANRRDELDENGQLQSRNADLRFPVDPSLNSGPAGSYHQGDTQQFDSIQQEIRR